ncbi:DNA cytosine methyltransferase [Paraliobacillus sp. X-1268]|uniref:DNA cytosine methyltransferase n=1 Tax=Paraliobacillus sp. X-1268 TaxID=2213193 RepID=UPI000E3C254D|nr:DNA cytosine methyltransferase [Paraliobacillus sp. X-1268]
MAQKDYGKLEQKVISIFSKVKKITFILGDKPQARGGEPMEEAGHIKWVFHGKNFCLSIKEIKRIQTFPDWFEFSYGSPLGKSGRETSHNAQIGNTVPVLLAHAIIQPIADIFKDILWKKYLVCNDRK